MDNYIKYQYWYDNYSLIDFNFRYNVILDPVKGSIISIYKINSCKKLDNEPVFWNLPKFFGFNYIINPEGKFKLEDNRFPYKAAGISFTEENSSIRYPFFGAASPKTAIKQLLEVKYFFFIYIILFSCL